MMTPAMGAAMKGPMNSSRKMGLNMAAMGFICASLLFRALGPSQPRATGDLITRSICRRVPMRAKYVPASPDLFHKTCHLGQFQSNRLSTCSTRNLSKNSDRSHLRKLSCQSTKLDSKSLKDCS